MKQLNRRCELRSQGFRKSRAPAGIIGAGPLSLAALLLCVVVGCIGGTSRESAEAQASHTDSLVSAETTSAGLRGRYALYRIKLRGAEGTSATGRLLRPRAAGEDPKRAYPAVLLEDGRELNSHAIDFLPPEFGDIVVLSLDYPDELPYEIELRRFFMQSDRLRRAARRVPAIFSLGASYLSQRADVDAARLVMVATSFAVPFAVHDAAVDQRFVNVGLVYGAGDMSDVLAANLSIRPGWLRRPAAWLAMRPFAEFSPERYVGRIAPRPLVMVNGVDDPQMPRTAVQSLYDAARQPKTLVWLHTGHLMPGDSALIRALVDTALARLPALRGVRPSHGVPGAP